ncbi:MAG: succinate dehydrogenase assembly factor 2 [Mariprofundaceae bacterium]|nr:succinate dehydrogenase assembly factor 2 [Mariprofundaceae bacterium]
MAHENDIRRLRYRLNRQGMLELDAWLAPLEKALIRGDGATVAQVEAIVAADTPELLAMMHGEIPLPDLLRPWLERS